MSATWRRSYSDADNARAPDLEQYIRAQRAVIAQAVMSSQVAVLCPEDYPEQIIGWICWRPAGPVVHYVYVKKPFQGHGFGAALLRHAAAGATRAWATHSRGGSSAWARAVGVRVTFNPGLIFE